MEAGESRQSILRPAFVSHWLAANSQRPWLERVMEFSPHVRRWAHGQTRIHATDRTSFSCDRPEYICRMQGFVGHKVQVMQVPASRAPNVRDLEQTGTATDSTRTDWAYIQLPYAQRIAEPCMNAQTATMFIAMKWHSVMDGEQRRRAATAHHAFSHFNLPRSERALGQS